MGIGRITSTAGMSSMQTPSAVSKDHKNKNIQKEITEVQQQIQKLSSRQELSANEKADERKKLLKEKNVLDNELRQHQEDLIRSQKREAMLAELREEQNPFKRENTEDETSSAEASPNNTEKEKSASDEQQTQPLQPGTVVNQSSDGTVILKEITHPAGNDTATEEAKSADESENAAAAADETDTEEEKSNADPAAEFRPTAQEMQAMVSSDASTRIADHMGTLVAKTDDGIAVLKGEIKLDAYRGTDTDRKEAELAEMQKKSQRETAFQFSLLDAADSAMQAAVETDKATKTGVQANVKRTFHVSGLRSSQQEEQAAQQGFQVSIT